MNAKKKHVRLVWPWLKTVWPFQIGYEPIAPRPGKTIFGNPTMVLPNIFQYGKLKKKVFFDYST